MWQLSMLCIYSLTANMKPNFRSMNYLQKLGIQHLVGYLILIISLNVDALAAQSERHYQLVVQPDTTLYHQPLNIEASGFTSHQKVSLQLEAIDAENNHWYAQGTYMANDSGLVNPAKMAPIGGTYSGVHPMGLFWSAKSDDDHQMATGGGYSATIKVLVNQKLVARKSFYRRSTRELDQLGIQLLQKRDSIIADYYLPGEKKKVPVIIFLGGSGGHFRQERSSLFASEGFAVLNLKYFKYEGLPSGITEIPLEYVDKAMSWLLSRPEVDHRNIGIMGRSMGSMLALLYAANFEGVRYVVAEAPSSVVWFGWEEGKSSLSYQGKSFPYAEYSAADSERIERALEANGERYHDGPKFLSAFKNANMIDRASIQIENIKCPILFISGSEDKVWPSTMMANRMMERLKKHQFPYDYQHNVYQGAGHNFAGGGQGCGIPYLPPEDYSNGAAKGGTDKGNALAAIRSWKDILAFVEQHQVK